MLDKIKDGDGKLINGMYYTVKYKNSGDVYEGTTQGSTAVNTERSIESMGLTLRYFTRDADEVIYLYIGHRTAADGYPESRAGTENTVDEAQLAEGVALSRKEMVRARRKGMKLAACRRVQFTDRGSGGPVPSHSFADRNDTIGIGHKITNAELANGRFDRGYWAEPLSDAKMNEMLDQDIAKNGGNDIDNFVFVPLHNYEVDAILDLGFNGGPGALNANASSLFTHNGSANSPGTSRQKLSNLLNRGRYSLVPEYFQTHYNTANRQWMPGVQNRRDMDARMFSGDTANGYNLLQNHTTRNPVHRNP